MNSLYEKHIFYYMHIMIDQKCPFLHLQKKIFGAAISGEDPLKLLVKADNAICMFLFRPFVSHVTKKGSQFQKLHSILCQGLTEGYQGNTKEPI